MLDREINQQSTKLPPYFVFCFGITYDCVKRVQASNNTLLDKPVNGVACPSNVESEAPNMRIDIQKRNMQQLACVERTVADESSTGKAKVECIDQEIRVGVATSLCVHLKRSCCVSYFIHFAAEIG